jgi:hypothetical protein
MKMTNKLMMMALVLGVFFGCSKDENLTLAGISGTYSGIITVFGASPVDEESVDPIPADILIKHNSEKNNATLSLTLNLNLGTLGEISLPISVECAVTITDSYSLSGETSFESELGVISVKIDNSSKINKSGKAVIDLTATVAGAPVPVKFEGQKK